MKVSFQARLIAGYGAALVLVFVLTGLAIAEIVNRSGVVLPRVAAVLVCALAAILILTACAWIVLYKRLIQPIRAITAQAERISGEDLSARLSDPGSNEELHRLVAVFNGLLARLHATFDAQKRFISRAAHELRTPLTILKGETQVMLRAPRSVEEYHTTLQSSLEEIDKLVGTIDDLLLMARYESGEAEIPRDTVSLGLIVVQVAQQLERLAATRSVELKIEGPEECFVLGDRKALARLVCKLIENALFYTRPGGRATVTLSRISDEVELLVNDTGVGIKAEDLPNIFQRFFRSPLARDLRPEGAGIGLPTVAVVAKLHSAQINVQSQENCGTCVQVRFKAA